MEVTNCNKNGYIDIEIYDKLTGNFPTILYIMMQTNNREAQIATFIDRHYDSAGAAVVPAPSRLAGSGPGHTGLASDPRRTEG